MRRPVKYKTALAKRNRVILTAVSSVAAVGVIGGAIAAVTLGQDEGKPASTDTDTSAYTEPAETGTDGSDTLPYTTEEPKTTETEPPAPVTERVTEQETGRVTEPVVPGPVSPITDVGTVDNYRGGYLDLTDYPTLGELRDAAKKLRAEGYTAVMTDLKYDNGKLGYLSSVKEADTYGANPSVAAHDLSGIVSVLHEAGLYVTGRVCALRDDIAAKGNSDAALMNEAGFRYSDGASRWLSVYSAEAQDYILGLLTEMRAAGVEEVMLRDYGLPADAGTTAPAYRNDVSSCDAVTAFIKRIDKEVPGLTLSLEMDAGVIAAGKDPVRGIDTAALGALAESVTADLTLSNLKDGVTVGGVTVADVDKDPAKTVSALLGAVSKSPLQIKVLLETTGNASVDAAQVKAAGNMGCAAYQMTKREVRMTEK